MIRVDKFLWSVRLFKTRSQASEECKSQKILVNHEPVKSSREIKIGDQISIKKNTAVYTYKVLDHPQNRIGAALVKNYLEDITPKEEKEKHQTYLLAQREYRNFNLGKPSKTDRRKLRNFLGD